MASQQLQRLQSIPWTKPQKLKDNFDHWVKTQPPYLEVLVAAAAGGLQGGILGGVMGQLSKTNPNANQPIIPGMAPNPDLAKAMPNLGGPLAQARNFAVMTGVNAGLSAALKKYRGKEDVQGAMIAAFGSGAAFSLVSGMTPGNPLTAAATTGIAFAVLQGAFFKLGKVMGGPPKKDAAEFARAKYMLKTLGLSNYERHIQKGLLTDNTIMLWNDRALQEVRIPPGPRLLILHHIDSYRNVLKPGMPLPGAH
ncbi:hypothetical protein WJX72_011234 [[Myrmecia] bisecta]|uniref:Mitochondrial import inner membrane translocase subunit Tim17/Tim22/Tim23 family protein n=1 Tax=[Myrmecia] bisecta TaxID=41462 RepID=A0AAW1QTH1_9CHLO